MQEPNGNARLSGSMASLCGLEKALEEKNDFQIHLAQKRIHLQHAIILSLGGIPMIIVETKLFLPISTII